MRHEWREYWRHALKKSSSIFLCIGVALIFFIANLPKIPQGMYLKNFLISISWGIIIYSFIWTSFAIAWAIVTFKQIKTGRVYEFNEIETSLIAFVGAILGVICAYYFSAWLYNKEVHFSNLWFSIVSGIFISLMFHFYYSSKFSKEENLELKAKNAEAQLHVLKNQMQPHFLFNSLNSLSELIDANQDHAAVMTQKLSDLYREILENSKSKTCDLKSELSIVQKYLELEKLRFGKRLSFSIEAPKEASQIFIPSLLLQTLVENAVKHGIAKVIDGGDISLKILNSGADYQLELENTGELESYEESAGTGLENTVSRLSLLYGDKHKFEIKSSNEKTMVSFHFSGQEIK